MHVHGLIFQIEKSLLLISIIFFFVLNSYPDIIENESTSLYPMNQHSAPQIV